MSTAPQIRFKNVSEIRNVAVDMRGKLDSGELLTGAPVAAELVTTALTLSNVALNTVAFVVNGSTVGANQAVQFKVSGGLAGISYTVRITAGTTANPAQTLIEHVTIKVISN